MPKIPLYPPIKRIEIRIEIQDQRVNGSNGFSNVQEMAQFLRDNPEIGKALGYVPKIQKRNES